MRKDRLKTEKIYAFWDFYVNDNHTMMRGRIVTVPLTVVVMRHAAPGQRSKPSHGEDG